MFGSDDTDDRRKKAAVSSSYTTAPSGTTGDTPRPLMEMALVPPPSHKPNQISPQSATEKIITVPQSHLPNLERFKRMRPGFRIPRKPDIPTDVRPGLLGTAPPGLLPVPFGVRPRGPPPILRHMQQMTQEEMHARRVSTHLARDGGGLKSSMSPNAATHNESVHSGSAGGGKEERLELLRQQGDILDIAQQQLESGALTEQQHAELMKILAELYQLQQNVGDEGDDGVTGVERRKAEKVREEKVRELDAYLRHKERLKKTINSKIDGKVNDVDPICSDEDDKHDEKVSEAKVDKLGKEVHSKEEFNGIQDKLSRSEQVIRSKNFIDAREREVAVLDGRVYIRQDDGWHHLSFHDDIAREIAVFHITDTKLPPKNVTKFLLSIPETLLEKIGGKYRCIRFGAPNADVMIDNKPYQAIFGGKTTIYIDDQPYNLQVAGPTPKVKIGRYVLDDDVVEKTTGKGGEMKGKENKKEKREVSSDLEEDVPLAKQTNRKQNDGKEEKRRRKSKEKSDELVEKKVSKNEEKNREGNKVKSSKVEKREGSEERKKKRDNDRKRSEERIEVENTSRIWWPRRDIPDWKANGEGRGQSGEGRDHSDESRDHSGEGRDHAGGRGGRNYEFGRGGSSGRDGRGRDWIGGRGRGRGGGDGSMSRGREWDGVERDGGMGRGREWNDRDGNMGRSRE